MIPFLCRSENTPEEEDAWYNSLTISTNTSPVFPLEKQLEPSTYAREIGVKTCQQPTSPTVISFVFLVEFLKT